MDPQLIGGNDSCRKLRSSVIIARFMWQAWKKAWILSIRRKDGTHAKHTRFIPNSQMDFKLIFNSGTRARTD